MNPPNGVRSDRETLRQLPINGISETNELVEPAEFSFDKPAFRLLMLNTMAFSESNPCAGLFRANREDASKCADDSRWPRQFPHIPVLERPCVHGASITYQVEYPGFAQRLRRPFV